MIIPKQVSKSLFYALVLIAAIFVVNFNFVNSKVIINEIMSSNYWTLKDEDNETPDWIELYNSGSQPVNLNGFRISDKNNFDKAWLIPDTIINPGDYILIYASSKNRTSLGNQIVKATKSGEFPYYLTDNYRFDYLKLSGDFEMTLDVLFPLNENLRLSELNRFTEHYLGNAGLMVRKSLDNGSPHAGIFSLTIAWDFRMYHYFSRLIQNDSGAGEIFRTTADKQQSYLKIIKHGKTVMGAVTDSKGCIIEKYQMQLPWISGIDDTLFVGVAFVGTSKDIMSGINVREISINDSIINFVYLNHTDTNMDLPTEMYKQNEMHTDFKIDSDGDNIFLWNPDGSLVDSLTVPVLKTDVSFGRFPDGSPNFYFFSLSTPRKPNKPGYIGYTPQPYFSINGGWYDKAVELTLSAEQDYNIFYTVDGSEPSDSSIKFTGENIQIDSTTLIRAKLFKEGYLTGETKTESYFINEYHGLPVVSVAINPNDLWDKEFGIFEQIFNGIEVKAQFELWETDKKKVYSSGAGVRLHGHGPARGLPQHSIRFYSRNLYGNDKFNYSFFGENNLNSYDKLILRNGGSDWHYALFRDGFFSELVKDWGTLEGPAYRPCVMYLNGEFWGVYGLCERVDEDFISEKYGLKKEEIDFFEDDIRFMYGDVCDYYFMQDSILTMNMDNPFAFSNIQEFIDIDNYIDYLIVNIYAANFDWPEHNKRFWASRENGFKWSWWLYDLDWSMGVNYASRANNDKLQSIYQGAFEHPDDNTFRFSKMFIKLMENTELKTKFINRTADLLNSKLLAPDVIKVIDTISSKIAGEIPRQKSRWFDTANNWEESVEDMRKFAIERPAFLREDFVEEYKLNGLSELRLNVIPDSAGYIKINSITPETYPWKGIYFQDVPVSLIAGANAGFKFSGWSGNFPGNDSIQILLENELSLTAIFEPITKVLDDIHSENKINISCHPIPATSSININFSLPEATNMIFKIYNELGIEKAVLINNQFFSQGSHSIKFALGDLTSGVYTGIAEYSAKGYKNSIRIILIK